MATKHAIGVSKSVQLKKEMKSESKSEKPEQNQHQNRIDWPLNNCMNMQRNVATTFMNLCATRLGLLNAPRRFDGPESVDKSNIIVK